MSSLNQSVVSRNNGDVEAICKEALNALADSDEFLVWQKAVQVLARRRRDRPAEKEAIKVALLGSYTVTQYGEFLKAANATAGLNVDVYECGYGQYRQEILDAKSGLYQYAPDIVILAVHHGELAFRNFSDGHPNSIEEELQRWTSLWSTLLSRMPVQIIQHNFALPPEEPFGHLSSRLKDSRSRCIQMLNLRLGEVADSQVLILDCERLAAWHGKERWFDPRYWHLSKQAVSLSAMPLLARHTAAVIMAHRGLTRKCLVLDLDNTLWGGVIGEDGLAGIKLGGGATGEAFVAFQEYIRELKQKGVILAVCSKNNDADAREPFVKHPEIRLRLQDFSVFVANWESKAENLRHIATTLNINMDSLVFVDDNPVECELIRQELPAVATVALPSDPALYVRTLDKRLLFETTAYTADDSTRTEQYRARAEIAKAEESAGSMEEFLSSLEMKGEIAPFNELDLPRIVQLIAKTNQFNLTTRRHNHATVVEFTRNPACVHFSLRLRDRFTDHGLVGILIGFADMKEHLFEIDTLLMSCRVIGRTAEKAMLHHASIRARKLGCTQIRGVYVPTKKNNFVENLYESMGFHRDHCVCIEGSAWNLNIDDKTDIKSEFIALTYQN